MSEAGGDREDDMPPAGCQAAVLRAFRELRNLGECEGTALRAALKVFTFHEPAIPPRIAAEIVQGWAREAEARRD
jgi:hypothetical protein